MAVTKYPNYLEELLKLKLKESDFNIKSKKLPTKHEKFKFSNVSEERLNLAVQLAQKDIMEGNIGHGFIQRKKAKDSSDDCDDQSGTICTCHVRSRDVGPNYEDLPIRTMSPPIRDENSKPSTTRKSTITEHEASVELNRSKRDVLKIIREIHEATSVDVRKRLSKEDPDEAERRKVRVAERSNRIGRLTYDLSRGTKDFLNDIRRGKRQECLKKLLHFYKESLKVLKLVAMQTNDSSNPRSFLRSKIFVDLVAILSDLSFSAVELNIDSKNEEREPAFELRKIVDSSGANGKPRVHFPRTHLPPSVPPPPSSPWSDQDYNNNIIQQQKQMQWLQTNKFPMPVDNSGDVNVIKMSYENGRPVSQELPKYQASVPNKVRQEGQGSKVVVGSADPDSRRQLLKKCLLLLMERNLHNGRRMGGGDELQSDKGQAKVKSGQIKTGFSKPRLNNVNKPRKIPPKAHNSAPRAAAVYPGRSILSDHRVAKAADSIACKHEVESENILRRTKSSPPRLSEHGNDEESSDEDQEIKRLKPRKAEAQGRRALKSPERHQRSRSLSRRVVCPNCGVDFESRRDFDRLKIVHESSSSGCRGDSDSDGYGGNSIEAFSSLTSSNIRKFDKKLKEFEIERMKIKERWPSGGIENRVVESPPLKVQAASERPWIEDFEKEFRRDVADAKSIFHHLAAGGESLDCGRADDFSAKLLHDWNRRDREFFSFRLFNGESHSENDRCASAIRHGWESPNKSQGDRMDALGGFDDGRDGAYRSDEDRVQLASKLASVALPQEPIDLMVNREALSEMLVNKGELKGQVKDGIMRLLNSQSGDGADNAFLSSRMAKDLLEDCLQQVCNEADFVGSEIVDRVYKSELSHDS